MVSRTLGLVISIITGVIIIATIPLTMGKSI